MKGGVLLNFILTNKEELVRDVKVRNKEGMRQIAGSQPWTSCSGICLGDEPGEERGSGELVDLQGLPPSCSRMVHSHVHEVKQRWMEACMDEQGAPEKTQTEKGSMKEMEAESGDLRGHTRCSLSMQGSG